MKLWVVTDGMPGMQNQALGLAEALGHDITVKKVTTRPPWKYVTPFVRLGLKYSFTGDPLTPPWPDVVIASGRKSIMPALYVKRASQGKTKVIYIQNPVISPDHFTAVVVPEHDRLKAENVFVTQGALHRVTEARLEAERAKFSPFISEFSAPRIAVILGGTNRTYHFTPDVAYKLGQRLKQLKTSLLITPSRRTDPKSLAVLSETLQGTKTYIWDGTGDNPYFAFLAWADAILVTCDSVSMISEARATSKPVYMIQLPGGDAKFKRFHDHWIEKGYVKWFEGDVDFASENPLNEMHTLAQKIKKMIR